MPAPERPDRSEWPVARLVAAALLVLVVAGGVYARAHTTFAFRTAPRLSATAVSITFLAVEAVGLVLVVLLVVTRRRRRRPEDDETRSAPANRWIVAAVNLAVFLMVLLLASWLLRRFHRSAGRPRVLPSLAPSAGSTHPPAGTLPTGATALWLAWLGVVVLAIAVVGALAWWRRRGGSPSPVTEEEAAPDTGDEALRAGRRALDASVDPRSAVIACYEAMERRLADAGVERAPAQTPEELLVQARGRDAVASERAATTLVELFGRARFSSRPVDASDVTTARNALADLLADTPDRARP